MTVFGHIRNWSASDWRIQYWAIKLTQNSVASFSSKLLFNSWSTIQMWGGDICAFVSVGSRRLGLDTPFWQALNYLVFAWTFSAINEIGKPIIKSRGKNRNKTTVLWKFITWHQYCEKQVSVSDFCQIKEEAVPFVEKHLKQDSTYEDLNSSVRLRLDIFLWDREINLNLDN